MFMNRVHTVTQKHSRVKNLGQKPNWLHEPPTGPASAPGHAQAVHGRAHWALASCRSSPSAVSPLERLPLMPRAPAARPARRSACSAPARDTPQRPAPAHPAPARPAPSARLPCAPSAHACAPQPAQLPAMQ